MTSTYRYRGNLSDTTLPEMLFSIDRFQVPGVVEARRGSVIKRVYVRGGYVIHASSTDRADSLGAYLEREGTISKKQMEQLSRQRQQGNKRFGVLLIERQLLSPVQVLQAIRDQLEGIVWSLFYWDEGDVSFGLGELEAEDMVQIQLPIRQVIIEGIRRAPNPKVLVARLGHKETVLEPCFEAEQLIETGLDEVEHRILRSVDGRKTLYELCSQGGRPPGEIAKLLYAFQVLHLVRAQGTEQQTGRGPVKVRLGSPGKDRQK